MANLTKDTSNNLWPVPITVAGVGTTTHILQTENKFVDANISIKVTTPAASGASLAITDKGSTNITVGTVSNGYYPLTTSLTGTLSVSTAGWLTTSGLSATDSSVTVGRIAQSTLANGTTTIASGATITPNVSTTQTINISAGYEGARTVVVGAMSSGTQAAATVSASKQTTAPTLANTASAVSGKTQVTVTPATGTSDISKYYIAMTATAPATSFAAANITKQVNTAGYLGAVSQITATNIATTANTTLYYAPLTTGAITISGSTTATAPTAANSSATVTDKTKITAAPTTATNTISTYYMAITVNAPATTVSLTKTVTPGYIGADSEVTASAATTAKSATYYIPVASGSLVSGNGNASASSGNVSLTLSNSQPSSGYYITVKGKGTVSTSGTAGWIAANTSKTSNEATAYYTIPTAQFTAVNGVVKTTSDGAGYIGANTTVGTISDGSLSNTASSGVTYTEVTAPILAAEGFLYINAGYFSNKKISLATLIPDDSNYSNAASNKILKNYEAYDSDGHKLIGTIETYNGEYTTA